MKFCASYQVQCWQTVYGFEIRFLAKLRETLWNPYPSPFNARTFLQYNKDTHNIEGTLYFWTHLDQTTTGTSNYAMFNLTGQTAAQVTTGTSATPTDYVETGQGFLMKVTSAGTVTFKNNMRTDDASAQFFKTQTQEQHRIWLNLSNESINFNQILIGYLEDATMDFDGAYDGKQLNGGTVLSSLIGTASFGIQARALPFVDTDVVPLRFKAASAGNFTISIDHVDGIFEASQSIYLKDLTTGETHDLTSSAYSFASEPGTFDSRFQVVYQYAPLSIPEFNTNQIAVYKQENVLNIHSGKLVMDHVKIFDIRGRLIYTKKDIKASATSFRDLRAGQQVLLVQIISHDGVVVTKKIVY